MSSEIAISVRGLSKRYQMFGRPEHRLKQMLVPRLQRLIGRSASTYYQEFNALREVSFDIGRGETVGIVGRNGSGKSTLLQLICGTLRPTAGAVRVAGRVAALLELGAGFDQEFTGRENVYLNAAMHGLSRAEVDARFEDIAAFADIGPFIDQPVKTYSSGMYVRLAFAAAIHVDPDVLVVDEALSVGDEAFQRKCLARIELMRSRGTTILFVSHSAQTVVQLCDRALWIDKGELRMDASPKDVVDAYQKSLEEARVVARPPIADEAPADLVMSEAVIDYPSRGGRIVSARITDQAGARVRSLEHARRYRFSYRLRLDQDVSGLRCGMLIKTTTGVEVAGAVVMPTGPGMASAGHVEVEFQFTCLMYPGRYFINCGAMAGSDGEEHYVHRLVDAFEIDVIHPSRKNRGGVLPQGLVDLDFAGRVVAHAE